ncbi:MAG: OB-fold nucleic acid binding domain-containing protein [Sandaracinaceae bacterium]|nr:OB-fold nucleic acid binding domain-containing protein [Sandaracinaceae bacterium]
MAAVALYRPGPLGTGMVEDFVQRKHGRVKVEYPHPCLQDILKDTYGVIVYQEQVMQIARVMGGYTLGGADLLRRAMGKKKESEMAKQRAVFVEGSVNNGHSAEQAGGIFDLVAHFAGYGFNKSHSAAYALITYQTAYLKAHYPVEFVCATLTADKDKTDKVVRTVNEARQMGITVLPPDVNESAIDFTVVYDPTTNGMRRREDRPVSLGGKLRDPMRPKIRFGLGGIKGIGGAALEAIFEARSQAADGEPAGSGAQQPFADVFDFASRVDLRRVNKGVAEALRPVRAFDAVHEAMSVHRAQAHAAIEAAIERGKKASADRESGQTSLFGLLEPAQARAAHKVGSAGFPSVPPWDLRELLAREKATLGFYVSGHPLERYASELSRFCDATTASLSGKAEGSRVTIGGSVEGYRERPTKTGGKMAFFHLEDASGRVEVIVRTGALEASREILGTGDPVLLTADVKFERDRQAGDEAAADAKLILLEVAPLAASLRARTKAVRLRLRVERTDRDKLAALKRTLEENPGPCPVSLELSSAERLERLGGRDGDERRAERVLPQRASSASSARRSASSAERLRGSPGTETKEAGRAGPPPGGSQGGWKGSGRAALRLEDGLRRGGGGHHVDAGLRDLVLDHGGQRGHGVAAAAGPRAVQVDPAATGRDHLRGDGADHQRAGREGGRVPRPAPDQGRGRDPTAETQLLHALAHPRRQLRRGLLAALEDDDDVVRLAAERVHPPAPVAVSLGDQHCQSALGAHSGLHRTPVLHARCHALRGRLTRLGTTTAHAPLPRMVGAAPRPAGAPMSRRRSFLDAPRLRKFSHRVLTSVHVAPQQRHRSPFQGMTTVAIRAALGGDSGGHVGGGASPPAARVGLRAPRLTARRRIANRHRALSGRKTGPLAQR